MFSKPKSVVTIGGGTGTYVVLTGLKDYPIELSAIVTMMDSGGSTGRLRDQLGVLPPGDLRQALVALSESSEIWRELFTYRFDNGDLGGHNFGNIFLSALEKITGSTQEAVDRASEILKTSGRVIPVTFTNSSLCAQYKDGTVTIGEANIDEVINCGEYTPEISYVYLSPTALINIEAKRVIERADFIIFGPGDLYTSIIPNLLVDGMPDVLKYSKAKKIYVSNLMTKLGQTQNFKLSDFIDELHKYMKDTTVDFAVVNNKIPPKEILSWYKEIDNAVMVEDNLGDTYEGVKIIRGNFLSKIKFEQSVSDRVKRSLIRHDPYKLAEVLSQIINKY